MSRIGTPAAKSDGMKPVSIRRTLLALNVIVSLCVIGTTVEQAAIQWARALATDAGDDTRPLGPTLLALAAFDAAVGLAERLNFVSTYLADLKDQYGDATGLSMVSEVLSRLAEKQVVAARPGSARDPDPDY